MAKRVGDPAEPSAAAEHPEPAGLQNHMNALPAEVARLVEVAFLLRLPRGGDGRHELENRALLGHGFGREVESRALVGLQLTKSAHPDRYARGELSATRRAGHLDDGERGTADFRLEQAPVKGGQPKAAPPEAGEE